MTLSEYIKQYRKRLGISQRTFAQRCNVSHAYIGFLEKGVNPSTGEPIKPSLRNLYRIAKGMDIRLDELLSSIDDMTVMLEGGESVPTNQLWRTSSSETKSIEDYLLTVYRGMDQDGQQRLIEQASMLYEKYRKE